jgi:hypothetical protein
MNKQRWKSIGAVLAGLLTIIIVSTLVDVVLHAVHVYPSLGEPMTNALAVLASSYRLVISIAGAYLTARLSPGQPMRDALVLGCVGTVLGVLGVVQSWDLNLGPRWYAISLAVLAIPQCWFGGWLFLRGHPAAGAPVPSAP